MAFYKSPRTRNLYDPSSKEPYRISRSKIDLFIKCPFCFYMDRRLGVAQPPSFPFNLNNAVDELLKKEFDTYREKGEPHPLMTAAGIDAVPYKHPDLDTWRDALRAGVTWLQPETNFLVTGGIDDVWVNPAGELIVADYKATSKEGDITDVAAAWQDSYRKQVEVYQWLFRRNGFTVNDTAYFVYANGDRSPDAFDARLAFKMTMIPHVGDDTWVEPTLLKMKECLDADAPPKPWWKCDVCKYRRAVNAALR